MFDERGTWLNVRLIDQSIVYPCLAARCRRVHDGMDAIAAYRQQSVGRNHS